MPSGIKNKIAVIGMGCSNFGEQWGKSGADLAIEAFGEALADAGIEKKDIDASWLSTNFEEIYGKSGIPLAMALKLSNRPVTRVENFSTSGIDSFRNACYAVASGACDIAMALGSEKLNDLGDGNRGFVNSWGMRNRIIYPNATAPGQFAMLATGYFAKYGLTPEEGKRVLARISFKSYRNGVLTPKAYIKREMNMEQIINAPIVAWPLGIYDCCGVSEGAACAIVCRAEKAKEYRKNPVYVKAIQIAASAGEELHLRKWKSDHFPTTYHAAMKAYSEADITNPREEISMLETHDSFSICELCTYEDLQISPRGRAIDDVESGFYDLGGKIPCQSDGGLKCFGHPIGASGIRMIYEIYKQLQGKVDSKRQIRNPRIGLAQTIGGAPLMSVSGVAILGNRL